MPRKTQNLLSAAVIAIFLIFAFACVTTKTYTSEQKNMLFKEDKVFVEKNNGTKLTGNKLKLPVNWMGKSKGMFLDGQEINAEDIVAFQDGKSYHRKFGDTWVKQLKRGRINLYYYETYINSAPYYDGTKMVHGTSKTEEHFVFQKGNDKMVEAGKPEISEMLKDNPEAYQRFNDAFKPNRNLFPKELQNKPRVLFEIIDIYNR